ncbi:flagellar hook-length control protein FliK [Bacillus suaedaesalsae]|uniref:Flagellar hook-length control protein FliK n=1 Tax=Bacillus suaedaesalsae TaxID=2810349 RepID=A0ABS2DIW3_9BACI|nr:flagellar hook-length control protein FliK [Bacillus suaedaesalsae]MBM6618442.1 flagellar hook-length control protein FliK [Bacillus suaedaesalsae]
MKIAGLATNQSLPVTALPKEVTKGKEKSPFATLLNNVNEGNNAPSVMKKDPKTGELIHPIAKDVQAALMGGEELNVEKLEELLAQLAEQGLLPQNLDVEMLQNANITPILELLPEELVSNLQQLFLDQTPIQEVMVMDGEQLPLVNILASLIYLNHASHTQAIPEDQQALLPLFNHLTNQLNKLEGGIQGFMQTANEDVAKEVEVFLSKFHTKLTGQQPIAIDANNSKLDYVKALYQRTLGSEDAVKKTPSQDSVSKVMVMGVEPQNSMNRVQQFALFVEQSSKPLNQEQFIKDFQNILSKSSLQNGTNGMRLLIKLYPEQLGSLRIELIQQQGVLVARMIASSTQAKELLESQLQGLKNAFANQNIQVEKLEIINSASLQQQFERSLDRDSNGQRGYSNKEGNGKDEQGNESQSTFEDAFKEELLNTEV